MDEVGAKIAICSLSCRYPDAGSPDELWDNLMEGRRSFRPIPPQRLAIGAYAAEAIGLADSITPVLAGLLTNWRFDREAFRIPKAAFDNTDLTHWLALQLAAEAIDGIGGLERLDRSRTAVIVANTLTGEFSRASLLRLRQPFLDEVLEEALEACSAEPDAVLRIRSEFATRLKSRFAEPNEDSLAGGLANTIAGRIANHFDLNGGAYTVDGACSSSLLAVANAAALLECGMVDAVVTGAVDLSLDPFELVGFSRNGALARGRMRVFDERSNGFWPGEGGAFSVLMRLGDAHRKGLPVRAVLRGWGMSTDGAGGLTRPDSEGQRLACARAHEMAATDPADLGYVEAHGTGTAVGDPAEISALAALRAGARSPLPVGSVKANIGHTKAAAGFAGLIKTVLALEQGGIPPHPGCEKPHSVFEKTGDKIYPLRRAQAFDADKPALAGVSSFGFGGINVHVVLEAPGETHPSPAGASFAPRELRGEQGAELFVFRAPDPASLLAQLSVLRAPAPSLSLAELADAAAMTARELDAGDLRLAILARDAEELCARLDEAMTWLGSDPAIADLPEQVFFGRHSAPEPVGFLFSGQAAPVRKPSPVWLARFPFLTDLARRLPAIGEAAGAETSVAQPAITFANLAAMAVIESLGLKAIAATGHSLGEISALAWSGAIGRNQALELATTRGALMSRHAQANGTMARLGLGADDSARLATGLDCGIACLNGLAETVLSGSQTAIAMLGKRASQCGAEFQPLKVSHAFHSPDMDAAVAPFYAALAAMRFKTPDDGIVSTVTGRVIAQDTDLTGLLSMQLVRPVLFTAALDELARRASLLIELGPGSGLARLAASHGRRAIAVDSQSDDLVPLLETLATVFAAGHDLDFASLYEGRGIRPFDLDAAITLLSNPCGSRGSRSARQAPPAAPITMPLPRAPAASDASRPGENATPDMVMQATLAVVAEETGLPTTAIDPDARFQSDLHLNSLAVTRIVLAVCKRLGHGMVRNPTDFAEATPAILASQLTELAEFRLNGEETPRVNGIRRWVAPYGMAWHACDLPKPEPRPIRWSNDPAAMESAAAGDAGLLINLADGYGVDEGIRLVAQLQLVEQQGIRRLAVVHDRMPVSSLFRSHYQEVAFETILLIDRNGYPESDVRIDSLLSLAPVGFSEYRLADNDAIERPVFERLALEAKPPRGMPAAAEVILAVGCHRGIGAECAFALADNRATLVFVGRSAPTSAAVTEVLGIARSRGIAARYEQCDVADPEPVSVLALRLSDAGLVPNVLLFAPAVNQPMRLASLTPEIVRSTLLPKADGLKAVLDGFGANLSQVIAFGSIIGRIGLEGECHYALANALQSRMVESFATAHPACRCLSLEWSVWSGAGMGERLGTIERLAAKGVDALSFDEALAAFERHVAGDTAGTVVMTGRFGPPAGLDIGSTQPRPLRFIDQILVDFPGTELVAETELNSGRDPYLADHCVDGRPVFPGVMGIEAMAQAVTMLAGEDCCRKITDITFHHAAVVERGGLRIRIAALRTDDTCIEAGVFTEDDDFQSPCFSACFHPASFAAATRPAELADARATAGTAEEEAAALYGSLFFQGRRFQRLKSFQHLSSRRVDARLDSRSPSDWFGTFEPAGLVVADPGVADTALHVLQATIAHRRVLPLSIGELVITGHVADARRIIGVENWTRGKVYSFDIKAFDDEARLVAVWRDVCFKAIGEINVETSLLAVPMLCQSYLERLAREDLDDESIRLALVRNGGLCKAQRRQQAIDALALDGETARRSDGRPIVLSGEEFLGLSHATAVSLAVSGSNPIACDIAELDACYPNPAGRTLTAEDWATGEVLRKLGEPQPFLAKPAKKTAYGALWPVPVVFTRSLPALGLAVAVGVLCETAPADADRQSQIFVEVAE